MLKSYKGRNLEDALLKVKADLGPSALVVETRGNGAKGGIEVLAAPDTKRLGQGRSKMLPMPAATDGSDLAGETQLRVEDELVSIRSTLQTLTRLVSPNLPGQFGKIRDRLQEQEVQPSLALSLIEEGMGQLKPAQFTDDRAITESVAAVMASKITAAGPIQTGNNGCKVVSLVGPTGVGKTTTIAKLSATHTLGEQHKVGVITVDTYRVAAVEQLKAFAEMLGIPFRVVFTPSELRLAVENMAGLDLVLIDTVGRSHWDRIRIQELKGFLQAVAQVEVFLVMSAGAKYTDSKDVVSNFSIVNPSRLVFTKIDETSSFGGLFNLATECDKPVSYLTTGQEVPDDIEVAEPRRIADLVLGDLISE